MATRKKPAAPSPKSRKVKSTKDEARKVRRSRGEVAVERAGEGEPEESLPTEQEILDSLMERSQAVKEEQLREIFGPEYAEVKQMALRAGQERGVRRGIKPKVLLLPGIMGSKLGYDRPSILPDDVVWLGLTDIVRGRLRDLILGAKPGIKSLGVFMSAYAKMALHLMWAGYDVDFHHYDWRQSVEKLGAELKARVEAEKRPVSIVAHSMGGLVGRAAFKQGMRNVSKFVMLATPNHGSLAPVEALRGQYGMAKTIAAVDFANTSLELATDIFSTFPGLFEMILSHELHPDLNLFDATKWPKSGPQPNAALLKKCEHARKFLAVPEEVKAIPWYLIAGVGVWTKVSAKVVGPEFKYLTSDQGDGTVPLRAAQLDGLRNTWYAVATHGSFANDGKVREATVDILATGETDVLLTTPISSGSRGRLDEVTEDELRRVREAQNRAREEAAHSSSTRSAGGGSAQTSELEQLAVTLNQPMVMPPPPAGGGSEAGLEYGHRLRNVTIGRRKQRRLEIALYHGSITDVDVGAYVLGTFAGVSPVGASRAVDELMEGALTDLTRHNMFAARNGEIFVMPVGRYPVKADVILMVGLGAFDRFPAQASPASEGVGSRTYLHGKYVPAIEVAAENAVRTMVRSNVADLATVTLGGSTGGDLRASGESMLRGLLRGLEVADHNNRVRRIVMCETDGQRFMEIKQHLIYLSTTDLCEDTEILLSEMDPPPEVRRLRALNISPVPARFTGPEPAYLLVRRESSPGGSSAGGGEDSLWRFSLLGPTSRAALRDYQRPIADSDLDAMLSAVAGDKSPTPAEVEKLGQALFKKLLPSELAAELREYGASPLVVLHDAAASRVPWETLTLDDGEVPALKPGTSRRFLASSVACSKWSATRALAHKVKVLLISDPTEDLPGAVREAAAVEAMLKASLRVDVDHEVKGALATKTAILKKLRSGFYDIVHYSGHAFFDRERPGTSGLLCAGHEVLTGSDLATVPRMPFLLMLNACQAAGIRGAKAHEEEVARRAAAERKNPLLSRKDTGLSVAETLLLAGIPNFIGTYWPVGDADAATFATTLYGELLKNASLGEAITTARNSIQTGRDWANYIHFGNAAMSLNPEED